jgi:hypothetical protein
MHTDPTRQPPKLLEQMRQQLRVKHLALDTEKAYLRWAKQYIRALGSVLYQCSDCGREHWVGRSCGNRHCPACGRDKTTRWLEKQARRLLPVHHFLVTFTVPGQVRAVLRGSQRSGYAALFAASSQTLRRWPRGPST